MTSPIADLLTRLRNASAVGKEEVILPASRMKADILRVLKNHNYISNFEEVEEAKKKFIKVTLRYDDTKQPVLRHLELVSKPGLRNYVGKEEIPYVLNGYGLAIISTSKGLMTDREARKAGIGGELICKIW